VLGAALTPCSGLSRSLLNSAASNCVCCSEASTPPRCPVGKNPRTPGQVGQDSSQGVSVRQAQPSARHFVADGDDVSGPPASPRVCACVLLADRLQEADPACRSLCASEQHSSSVELEC